MQTEISSIEQFNTFISSNKGAVIYFSTPDCNVCKVLKPKLLELLQREFPNMKFIYVNVENSKRLAAQLNIFTVPTILFFFEGREYFRKSRFVDLHELNSELGRIYNLIYN